MRRTKGFTLLEVLISAVLIIIGVGSIGITAISVRRFFKDSEDRSRAMRLASSKIEEFLAKGYSGNDAPSSLSDSAEGFDWILNVSAETASGSIANIPYKKAEAVVSYTADKGRGGLNSIKNIRLANIIAYPMSHSLTITARGGANAKVPWVSIEVLDDYAKGCSSGGCDCYDSCVSGETDCLSCAPFTTDKAVGPDDNSKYLRLDGLRWNVKKDIDVIYSISLSIEDRSTQIQPTDTVYTACFFDDKQYGPVSRTPLRSQPSFSNHLVLKNAERDIDHTIEIRWYYSNVYTNEDGVDVDEEYTTAEVSLNEAILTVLAVEKE